MTEEKPLLNVHEAASRLEISEWSVRYYVREGELQCVPFMGRELAFTEEQLGAFVKAGLGLRVDDVARLFNCSKGTVYNWISKGRLVGRKVRGFRIFDLDEVRRFGLEQGYLGEEDADGLGQAAGLDHDSGVDRAEAGNGSGS